MQAQVSQLFIHPVKGLRPAAADRVSLVAGHGIRGDRAFALLFTDAEGATGTREQPFLEKPAYAVQNDWPALASLESSHDAASGRFFVREEGKPPIEAKLSEEADLCKLDAFFTGFLAKQTPTGKALHPKHAPLRWVGSPDGSTRYPDRNKAHVSILNLASLRELSTTLGTELDVRRFRGNIILDGLRPWEELDWIGRSFALGGAAIKVEAKIARCKNVDVHPERGVIDAQVLRACALSKGRGSFGMVCTVEKAGELRVGDAVVPL